MPYLVAELVKLINYMHNDRKVAHMDFKLENVVIDVNGKLRLIDFNHSVRLTGKKIDQKEYFHSGTILFKAPELFAAWGSGGPISADKADIFTLGIAIYVLTKKELPFPMRKKRIATVFEAIDETEDFISRIKH